MPQCSNGKFHAISVNNIRRTVYESQKIIFFRTYSIKYKQLICNRMLFYISNVTTTYKTSLIYLIYHIRVQRWMCSRRTNIIFLSQVVCIFYAFQFFKNGIIFKRTKGIQFFPFLITLSRLGTQMRKFNALKYAFLTKQPACKTWACALLTKQFAHVRHEHTL